MAAILADAALLLHAAFIAWAVLGGLAALRRPWLAALHLPALAWAVWVEASGSVCPLTPLEQRLRADAGGPGYEGSFVEHYLGALVYPAGLTREAQGWLALALLAFNLVVYAALARRLRGRRGMP